MAWKIIINNEDVSMVELEEVINCAMRVRCDCTLESIGALLRDKLIFASDQEIQSALNNVIKENKISKAPTCDNQFVYYTKTVSRQLQSY